MTKQPPNRRSPDDLANLITAGQPNSAATTTEERHFGIRIARDGKWHYLGTTINRPALPKLFATVLKKDDGGAFWLETPVEKGRIDVDVGGVDPVRECRAHIHQRISDGGHFPVQDTDDRRLIAPFE